MSNQESNPLKELLETYNLILEKSEFSEYVKYEDLLDQLYIKIADMRLTEEDRMMIAEIQELHGRIIRFITLEKESLSQKMVNFSKRKRVTQSYGGMTNNYDVGAFFVDFKK